MGAGSRILSELTDDAVRWVESLANKISGKPGDSYRTPRTPEQAAAEMGDKLVSLDKNAPQMLDIYDDRALYYALMEAQAKDIDLGLIKPDTFREAAAEIPMGDPFIRDMVDQKVRDLRDLRSAGIRYSDVPYLSYTDPVPNIAQITAHEGRHRSRALDAEGEPSQLVRFIPSRSEDLLSTMSPDTQLMNEIVRDHTMTKTGGGGKPIGTLGELIKFLSIGGVAAPGVLSQLGDGDAPQVP